MREERKTVRGLLESIDTETILKEGCIPAGGRGSGKSTLGMWIVRKLRMDGVSFKIIDISLVWSWCSPMFFPAFHGVTKT